MESRITFTEKSMNSAEEQKPTQAKDNKKRKESTLKSNFYLVFNKIKTFFPLVTPGLDISSLSV